MTDRVDGAGPAGEEQRYRALQRLDPLAPGTLPLLLAALDDPSWRVQAAAAERLAEVPDPGPALPALLGALAPGTPPGRASASAAALLRLGALALPALVETLASDAAPTRTVAAEILGELGDRRAVAPLAARLLDPDENVRAAAVEALGKLGGPEAAGALRRALLQDDATLRRGALDGLARLHSAPELSRLRAVAAERALRRPALRLAGFSSDPDAADLLLDGLADASRAVREAAMAGLGQQRFRRGPALARAADGVRAAAARDPHVLRLALSSLASEDAQLKAGAITIVQWAGGPEDAPALARAAEDERVRAIASEAIEALGPGIAAALSPALPALPPGARSAVLAALARLREPTVLGLLCEDAASPDDAIRAAALDGLAALGDPRAILPLATLLDHRDPVIAAGAVTALERLAAMGDAMRVATLFACRARRLAAPRCRLLGRVGGPDDAATLRQAVVEADAETRVAAAGALAAIAGRGLLRGRCPELLDAIDDLAPPVRAAAADALGAIVTPSAPWPEATRALAVALRDEDAEVRAAAATALGRMGAVEYAGALADLAADPAAAPDAVAAAIRALAAVGRADGAVLERAARHPDPEVVKEAVAAAAALADEAGAALLVAAGAHARWDVRRAAALAIRARGDRSMLDDVRRLAAGEADPLVAEALAEAARALEGRSR
jgi:HEAT repeat protein